MGGIGGEGPFRFQRPAQPGEQVVDGLHHGQYLGGHTLQGKRLKVSRAPAGELRPEPGERPQPPPDPQAEGDHDQRNDDQLQAKQVVADFTGQVGSQVVPLGHEDAVTAAFVGQGNDAPLVAILPDGADVPARILPLARIARHGLAQRDFTLPVGQPDITLHLPLFLLHRLAFLLTEEQQRR